VRAPRTPAAARAIELFDDAPGGDRFHVRARWWSCPFPAIERSLPVAGRVLEIGCGHGLLSLYLALCAPGRRVEGIDIDAHKIELARQAASHLAPGEATVSFATVKPAEPGQPAELPDGPFDAIVVNDVLYLMPEPMRRAVLEAAAAALAPDGVLVVKELDVAPRWKHAIGHTQELVATRVLSFTAGEVVEIAPMQTFADQLAALGLTTTLRRVDRGYPHPHALITARRGH